MTADQINTRILGRLDELTTGAQEPSIDADVLRFEAEQAALDVLTHADLLLLAGCAEDVKAEVTLTPLRRIDETYDTYAAVNLPAGTLRIARVKMASWIVPLKEDRLTYTDEGLEAFFNRDAEPGLRYPAAFVDLAAGLGTDGGWRLYVAPFVDIGVELSDGTAAVIVDALEELSVVRATEPENVPDALADALIWKACARLLSTYLREPDLFAVAEAGFAAAMQRAEAGVQRFAKRAPSARVTTRAYRPYG